MAQSQYYAERNLWGRHGKLYMQTITTDASGNQALAEGGPVWLSNVNEVQASMSVDRMEVRRAGDRVVRYKAGEVTGEGSVTMDKVNSDFETFFIDYINRRTSDGFEIPVFELHINQEDPSIPGIVFDDNDNAISGHESIILKGVNFWSMPLGYGSTDMITRDLDFTFTGISYGINTDNTPQKITDPAGTITRYAG